MIPRVRFRNPWWTRRLSPFAVLPRRILVVVPQQWILFLGEVEGFSPYWWRHLLPLWEGATFHHFPGQGACPGRGDSPHSAFGGVRRSNGDVRAFPRVRRSHNTGSPSSSPAVIGYEWVRDNVLKYKFSLTSARVSLLSNARWSWKSWGLLQGSIH